MLLRDLFFSVEVVSDRSRAGPVRAATNEEVGRAGAAEVEDLDALPLKRLGEAEGVNIELVRVEGRSSAD